MLISFNLLLYNLTFRGLDPIVACEKIKAGTDLRFVCFDRLEVEAEMGYFVHINRYDAPFLHELTEARKKVQEAPPEVTQLGNLVEN